MAYRCFFTYCCCFTCLPNEQIDEMLTALIYQGCNRAVSDVIKPAAVQAESLPAQVRVSTRAFRGNSKLTSLPMRLTSSACNLLRPRFSGDITVPFGMSTSDM